MRNKNIEALITGFILWLFGVAAILIFGNNLLFSRVAVVAVFGTVPVIYYLTKLHLRDVKPEI